MKLGWQSWGIEFNAYCKRIIKFRQFHQGMKTRVYINPPFKIRRWGNLTEHRLTSQECFPKWKGACSPGPALTFLPPSLLRFGLLFISLSFHPLVFPHHLSPSHPLSLYLSIFFYFLPKSFLLFKNQMNIHLIWIMFFLLETPSPYPVCDVF